MALINLRRPLLLRSVLLSFWLVMLGLLSCHSAQLPLASVRYFNPYQNPTSWGGWGSAIYQGSGASVRNVSGAVPVESVSGTSCMVLDATNPPGGYWNVLFKVSGNSLNFLRTGTNPAVRLRLKWSAIPTNNAWNMNVSVAGVQRPLNAYVTASTSAWQEVFIPASDFKAANPNVDLTRVWFIGLYAAGNYRDRCVLNIAAMDVVPGPGQITYVDHIKVNQVGYTPLMSSKLGIISWEPGTVGTPPASFRVVDAVSGQVAFTGSLTPFTAPNIWQAPGWTLDGDVSRSAQFGALRAPGRYWLEISELSARSPEFVIETSAYQELFRDALRFFYYSRSGVAIVEPFAEGFTRNGLYLNNTNAAYNYSPTHGHFNFGTNTRRDAHGCWFDAGDTHVDVPNTVTACWFLLETYRDFQGHVAPVALGLPESSTDRSDLLPLISWGLDWLKRMQNPDGSVHQYVRTSAGGNGATQEVSDISSFATACAAAAFAKSCAVLDTALSSSERAALLSRAQLAWSWLQANTNMVQPRLPLNNGVDPGADDNSWGDATFDRRCRAFAAVELYEATGQLEYNNAFVSQWTQNGGSPLNGPVFGVNQTGYGSDNVLAYLNHPLNFAFLDYARSDRAVNSSARTTLRNAFLHQANVLTNYTALSAYRIPMLYPGHLYWGSSGGVLAPSAMVLARAFQWTGNTNYHQAAMDALHFVCGRNPVNRVFVSGYGDYQHSSDFYSQFWTNLLHQPPGHLGGNINVTGSSTPVVEHPWKRFINTQDADMTEPGVYWNSAFAWLAGYAVNDAALPKLTLEATAGGLRFTWPLLSTRYALYSNTNLASQAAWASVTNQVSTSNGICSVVLPTNNAVQKAFYRLNAP